MKTFRLFLCLVLLMVSTNAIFAQNTGKVLEERTVNSSILGRAVKYSVYLPADYDVSERTYPVLYLLHGYTDDNTGWVQFGEINRLVGKAVAEGTIPPMIIIMPNGDSSFYINSYDGKEKYEDFFIKEFMPTVEKTYRIKGTKRYRALAGLSMGGYGSLIYALKYPDLFAATAPLSAAVIEDAGLVAMPDKNYDVTFGPLFGRGLKGKSRINDAYLSNSVLDIVQRKSADDLKKVRYYIDCGDDDFLSKGNSMLHIALIDKQVPHEYRVRDGAHTWNYWRTGIIDALQFIGVSFRQ